MIFFREPSILKRWSSWIVRHKFPLALFFGLWIHGSLIGLSDDEAYYWVLAQKPALGYAYHPPLVAWVIYVFQKVFSPIWGENSVALVRLPAVLCTTFVFHLSVKWISEIQNSSLMRATASSSPSGSLTTSLSPSTDAHTPLISWVLLSFFGLFFLGGWMMVPDLPLLLGWMMTLISTWRICFREPQGKDYFGLGWGAFCLVLSKFSGVLAVFSSLVCLLIWADRKKVLKGFLSLSLGVGMALMPILIWNYQHEWGAILYQIQERHSHAGVSWARFLRFWIAQMILAGPILFIFLLKWIGTWFQSMIMPRTQGDSSQELPWDRYLMIWILPGLLVFFVQPLFSDFKLHWTAVVWWPVLLGFAVWVDRQRTVALPRSSILQVVYGLSLGVFIIASCHFPIVGVLGKWIQGEVMDSRLDVTNDFYGWSELSSRMKEELSLEDQSLVVTASRYQTASQASFALKNRTQVTLLPRDLKSKDEWPFLDVAVTQGPAWPRLTQAVLYVLDQRYFEPPHYEDSTCEKLKRFEFNRWGYPVKWIELWKCVPQENLSLHFR